MMIERQDDAVDDVHGVDRLAVAARKVGTQRAHVRHFAAV
jgi:hypothetical protein